MKNFMYNKEMLEKLKEEIKNSTGLLLVIILFVLWIYLKNEQIKELEYNFETYSQELNSVLDKYPQALKLKKEYDTEFLEDYLR